MAGGIQQIFWRDIDDSQILSEVENIIQYDMDDSQILSKGRISFKVCLEKFQYIDVRESSRLSIPAVVYIARQSHKGFDVAVRYFPS